MRIGWSVKACSAGNSLLQLDELVSCYVSVSWFFLSVALLGIRLRGGTSRSMMNPSVLGGIRGRSRSICRSLHRSRTLLFLCSWGTLRILGPVVLL